MGRRSTIVFITLFFTLQFLILFSTADGRTQLELNQNKIPHTYLEITSDAQLNELAMVEGWNGDGSEDKPYLIENYLFNDGIEKEELINTYMPATVPVITHMDEYANIEPFAEFMVFGFVISNVDSYVKIQHNNFAYTMLVYNSDNVEIHKNIWNNEAYPWNLLVISDGSLITENTFTGSIQDCSSLELDLASPRLIIYGIDEKYHHIIRKNQFTDRTGCHPVQNLVASQDYDYQREVRFYFEQFEISGNWFKTTDVPIAITSGARAWVYNNQFQDVSTTYPIGGDLRDNTIVENNNFIFSGTSDEFRQNYIDHIHTFETPKQYGSIFNSNYYSIWNLPDDNEDGAVDQAFPLAINMGNHVDNRFTSNRVYDLSPSTQPFPYYELYEPSDKENGNSFVLISATLFSLLVLGVLGGSQVYQRIINSRQIYDGEIQGKTREIIKQIFNSQTVLYYTLIGQSRIGDGDIEENLKKAIPKHIYDFKFLLHPIRLSMTKLLYENLELTSIDMKNILEVSWNDYTTHATALKNKGYISIEEEFVQGSKRHVLRLEQSGITEYKALTDLLHLFLDNSTDYQAYIDTAQRKIEGMDPRLYPQ